MDIDLKKKISAAVDHVKANPIPYTILATATACAVIETVYFHQKTIVDLDKLAAHMEKTGKGVWFGHKKTGKVILMKLANIKDLA